MTVTKEEILSILPYYHKQDYVQITDYEQVYNNREQINENITMYPTPCQPIYLNNEGYAITYKKQHIIDNYYYYDFNPEYNDDTEIAGTYTKLVPLEWKRNKPEDP